MLLLMKSRLPLKVKLMLVKYQTLQVSRKIGCWLDEDSQALDHIRNTVFYAECFPVELTVFIMIILHLGDVDCFGIVDQLESCQPLWPC